jgi:hypothetical protein
MERIGTDVGRQLRRFGPAAGMADIVSAWPAAVGATVAQNAWPARLARDGTLHVAARDSLWAFELAQLAPTMLEQLRAGLGEAAPSALRFAPGRLPELSGEPVSTATLAPAPPTSEERAIGEALASEIADEDLRALVARAAAASLAKAAADR